MPKNNNGYKRREDSVRLVSPRIIIEIEEKMKELRARGFSFLAGPLRNKYLKFIEEEAIVHSARLEDHEERALYENGNGNKEDKRRRKESERRHIENIYGAHNWGWSTLARRISQERDLLLDANFVKTLAFKAEPQEFLNNLEYEVDAETGNNIAKYREGSVRVGKSSFTPPYGEKIPAEMNGFILDLNARLRGKRIGDWVEGALLAHFQMARIHPFSDGNGRTARTLQNVILKQKGLPPPLIYAGTRSDYYAHIEEAVKGWRNRKAVGKVGSQEEAHFYNYLAGQISGTLDNMIDRLNGKRR